MFPLRDSIPSARPPVMTVLIILVCAVGFLWELLLGRHLEGVLTSLGFVPARLFHPEVSEGGLAWGAVTVVSSMFLHGGWLHLIGNMWFLWVFGDNVEDALGHGFYVAFYLLCGTAAALAQAVISPASTVPMIGASGAIAGVLGAYLVWFPWSRVKTLVFLFIFATFVELPAPLFLIVWFVIQFFSGTLQLAAAGASGSGVAFFAHMGGFLTGAVLAVLARRSGRVRIIRYTTHD